MGRYLNPGNEAFQIALNSLIYVDKTGLAAKLNAIVSTIDRYVCVSRPRRFGKTMAAEMLCAYYGRSCDSRELFEGLALSKDPSFEEHLNRYDVIRLNIQAFMRESDGIEDMLDYLTESLVDELADAYPKAMPRRIRSLANVLESIYAKTDIRFVFLIDEWDCVLRLRQQATDDQTLYLDWLRNLLKDRTYVALAYMTGILPIKKYGQHSALNMFTEVAVTDAKPYSEFTGFTEEEVATLCQEYGRDLDELRSWYDGYTVDGIATYNPRSVVQSLTRDSLSNYWTQTETFDALRIYINMDMDRVRESVVRLVAAESLPVDVTTFQNDMTSLHSSDDVLTLLVHLGYLTYERATGTVRIPNREVMEQFASTLRDDGWHEVARALTTSDELLRTTLARDEQRVAELVAQAHEDAASILRYNDENSLACAISLAFYTARRSYKVVRELPTGKGFADLAFIPLKGTSGPALVVELKSDGTEAEGALAQIRERRYAAGIQGLSGEVLLVGIAYDPKTKEHRCSIEQATL